MAGVGGGPLEAGLRRTLLDDQRDTLRREPLAQAIPAVQPSQERPGGEVRDDLPVEHGPHRTVGRVGYARDGQSVAFALLIGFRARDPHLEPLGAFGEILDIERDELRAAQRRGIAEDRIGPA